MNQWLSQFFLKALYGAIGTILTAVIVALSNYQFHGNQIENILWMGLISGLTGVAAVVKKGLFPTPAPDNKP